MTLALRISLGFALACALVYALTPYAITLARRLSFYDQPVGYKGHLEPTPYLGGAALMAGFVVALLAVAGDFQRTLTLLGGAALLWLLGTIDDHRPLSPRCAPWSSSAWEWSSTERAWAGICTAAKRWTSR